MRRGDVAAPGTERLLENFQFTRPSRRRRPSCPPAPEPEPAPFHTPFLLFFSRPVPVRLKLLCCRWEYFSRGPAEQLQQRHRFLRSILFFFCFSFFFFFLFASM